MTLPSPLPSTEFTQHCPESEYVDSQGGLVAGGPGFHWSPCLAGLQPPQLLQVAQITYIYGVCSMWRE